MENTDTLAVIYNVYDLRTAFKKIKKDGFNAMMQEPLLKVAAPSSAEEKVDPAEPKRHVSCLENCPGLERAKQAEMALGLLARLGREFNDNSLIGFNGKLSEFPSSKGDASAKPFSIYFSRGGYRLVSEQEAKKTEQGAAALAAGALSLNF